MERQLVTKPGTPEAKTNDYRPSSLSYESHFPIRGLSHYRKNPSNRPKLYPAKLQTKLEVSQPGDSYEQEAEQVAEMPSSSISSIDFSKISIFPDQVQRKCSNFCAPHTGFNSPGSSYDRILQPQITADNKAVQRLIKSGALQAKLRIGQPNDIYEQEADRVAEQIIKIPKSIIQKQTNFEEEKEESFKTKLSVNHITPLVQRQVEDENEEKPIKRKEADQNFEVSSDIHTMINSLQGGGQPLPNQVRSYFEPRFGQDFGHVRVHTDSNAVLAARAINAKAFTIGNDVVFGAGQYAPNEVEGRRLLGHELTHVVQQRGKRSSINAKEESDENLSWWDKTKKWAFEEALDAAGIPKEQMMGLIRRAGSAISSIFEDPGRFLSTLIKAVGQGFVQFKDRIGEHLKAGFMGWLFGTMSKTGIVLPKDFSPESILSLVLQVLGITASFIRQKFVKIVGEKNVQRFEKAWQVLSTLMNEGIGGLWKMLKEHLGNLKEMVIDQIRNWVITDIIKSAVMKVVSMFNPVSGLITIIKTIYNVIKFLIERARQIKDLFAAIVESVVELAMGSISNAANKIEQALARLIPIAIGFLASLLGISGITDKIKEIIKRVSSMVDRAIDKVVEKAAKIIRSAGKLPGSGKEKTVPSKTENAPTVEPLTMSGISHELILIPGPSPEIEFASQNRGILSNKIGKVIGQLMRQDPKPEEQINDLKAIAKMAKNVQKIDFEVRKGTQKKLNKIEEFKNLSISIKEYSVKYKVSNIDVSSIKQYASKKRHTPTVKQSRPTSQEMKEQMREHEDILARRKLEEIRSRAAAGDEKAKKILPDWEKRFENAEKGKLNKMKFGPAHRSEEWKITTRKGIIQEARKSDQYYKKKGNPLKPEKPNLPKHVIGWYKQEEKRILKELQHSADVGNKFAKDILKNENLKQLDEYLVENMRDPPGYDLGHQLGDKLADKPGRLESSYDNQNRGRRFRL